MRSTLAALLLALSSAACATSGAQFASGGAAAPPAGTRDQQGPVDPNTVCSSQSVSPPGVPRLCNSQRILAEERAAAAPLHTAGQAGAVQETQARREVSSAERERSGASAAAAPEAAVAAPVYSSASGSSSDSASAERSRVR